MYFKILIISLSVYYELIKNMHIKNIAAKNSNIFKYTIYFATMHQKQSSFTPYHSSPIQVLFKSYSSLIYNRRCYIGNNNSYLIQKKIKAKIIAYIHKNTYLCLVIKTGTSTVEVYRKKHVSLFLT